METIERGAGRRGAADPGAAARAARSRRSAGRRARRCIHLLFLAALRGISVRGPMVGKRARLRARPRLARRASSRSTASTALAELARRYLAGHGPADDRDLARWAGLPLRDARAGLEAIASELVEREDGLVDLAKRPPPAPLPAPRLLGAFDPLLLGWTSREEVVGPHKRLVTDQRDLPALRPGRRPRRRHLGLRGRQGDDQAARQDRRRRRRPPSRQTPSPWRSS